MSVSAKDERREEGAAAYDGVLRAAVKGGWRGLGENSIQCVYLFIVIATQAHHLRYNYPPEHLHVQISNQCFKL